MYTQNTKTLWYVKNYTEEVMDKLVMFQDILGTIDKFDWWDLE